MPKVIPLTQNMFSIIDDDDYDRVNEFSWYVSILKQKTKTRYSATRTYWKDGRNYTVQLHRFIMNATDPNIHIDHINRNPLDNRKENLRVSSSKENSYNKARYSGSSGFKGVRIKKRKISYEAYISKDRKRIRLGTFKSLEEAARAYDKAALEMFGEFACTNKMLGLLD